MIRLREFWNKLRYFGRRRNLEGVFGDEAQFHVESRAEELEQTGLSKEEALMRAHREFGPMARMREESRAAWQIRWLEDLSSDLRYAFRALRRGPGFTAAAIFSLALGIGANTTIFSLTMEFLFSEPSVRQADRLVSIRLGGNSHATMADYRFLRDSNVFTGLAGSFEEAAVNWRNGEASRRLSIYRVTDNFFEVAGVPVAMGRGMMTGERNVAVLEYSFWENQLGGDRSVLGRSLILDGEPHTVVGILPRDHRTVLGFGFAPAMYLPVRDENAIVALLARLPDGMARPAAIARLKATCQELDRVRPERDFKRADNIEMDAVGGAERLKSVNMIPFEAFFGLLMVVVGLVLVIACANVASLLLARASSRRQELGIRLAIGAGRGRLIRQLLAESLLLAVMGTAAGLAVNLWLTSFMNRIDLPLPIRLRLHISPDWRLLLYAAAIAIASALFCGLLPALKATGADVHSALKEKETAAGGGRWNMRSLLVIGQLTVSILLLSAGLLFVRNLIQATSMNPGFDVEHTVWAAMRLVPERYTDPHKARAVVPAALEKIRALPGVEAAAVVRVVPLNDQQTNFTELRTDVGERVRVQYKNNSVGPDYFRVMAIPIVAGREFLATDLAGSPAVAIVNENFARKVFGERNPVGHSIRFRDGGPVTIVGVAKNSKYFTLGEENALAMYYAYAQEPAGSRDLHFLARASSPGPLVKPVTKALTELDGSAAIETKPMRDAMTIALLPSRVGGAILGSVGVLGLVLASVGLYGVLAYTISRRIREIGLRMALGAAPRKMLGMVFRDSFLLVGTGLVIGLGIAAVATRPLAMFLVPGLRPDDALTFVTVVVVLLIVAGLATIGPALRALRVDPMVALRYE